MCKTTSKSVDIQTIAGKVYIDGQLRENVKLETTKCLEQNRAYRVLYCDGEYYRQNGYYEEQRGKSPKMIFDEQEWYKVKPEKRVAYVYE